VAAVLAGWFVGVLPYLVFGVQRRWFGALYVLGYLAVAVVVAFSSVTTGPSDATEQPSRGEWSLAAFSATGEGAITTIVGLLLYGLGYWGAGLVNAVAVRALGFSAPANPESWAFWVSVIFTAAMGLAFVGIASEKLTRTLYPEYAGARSAYFPLLDQHAKLIGFSAGVAAALAGTVILSMIVPGVWWAAAIPTVILVYVAMPLDNLAADARPRQIGVTDRAADVLRGAGYTVVKSPRTGHPEVDPLIKNVTLLASAGDDAYAIEITERQAQAPVQWPAASGVRTASTVLQQRMMVDGRHLSSVRPILIVVDGSVAPSLKRFSEQENVPVVQVALAASTGDRAGDGGERLIAAFKMAGMPMPVPGTSLDGVRRR